PETLFGVARLASASATAAPRTFSRWRRRCSSRGFAASALTASAAFAETAAHRCPKLHQGALRLRRGNLGTSGNSRRYSARSDKLTSIHILSSWLSPRDSRRKPPRISSVIVRLWRSSVNRSSTDFVKPLETLKDTVDSVSGN